MGRTSDEEAKMRYIIVVLAIALAAAGGQLVGWAYDDDRLPITAPDSVILRVFGECIDSVVVRDTTDFGHVYNVWTWPIPDSLDSCYLVGDWEFREASEADTQHCPTAYAPADTNTAWASIAGTTFASNMRGTDGAYTGTPPTAGDIATASLDSMLNHSDDFKADTNIAWATVADISALPDTAEIFNFVTDTIEYIRKVGRVDSLNKIINHLGYWTNVYEVIIEEIGARYGIGSYLTADTTGLAREATVDDALDSVISRGNTAWITGGASSLTDSSIWAYSTRTITGGVLDTAIYCRSAGVILPTFWADLAFTEKLSYIDGRAFGTISFVQGEADSVTFYAVDGVDTLDLSGAECYFFARLTEDSAYAICETLTIDTLSQCATMYIDSSESNIRPASYQAEVKWINVTGYRTRKTLGKLKIIAEP